MTIHLRFALDPGAAAEGAEPFFPEPECLGFVGGAGNGVEGSYGNQMGSIIPVGGGWRAYLTRRVWTEAGVNVPTLGYVDFAVPGTWPALRTAFRPLVVAGLPETVGGAHPFALARDGRVELYFWAHGDGMVRYVRATGGDGVHFTLENLDRPCLYHPADRAVRADDRADGLVPGMKRPEFPVAADLDPRARAKVSNDATSLSYDPATRRYQMYSVSLLDAAAAPERVVAHDNITQWLRAVHRRESGDGLEWSAPELVLVPDPGDPVDTQFYMLQQLRLEPGYALVANYYPAAEQTMELMPAASADGRIMLRPRRPWRLRERLDGWSGGTVEMLFPGGLFRAGDDLCFAAMATNFRHNRAGRLEPKEYVQETAVFRVPAARWVGLAPRADAGGAARVVTAPFPCGAVRLEAEAPETTRIALLSAFGRVLAEGRADGGGHVRFADRADTVFAGQWVRLAVTFAAPAYGAVVATGG